MSSISNPAAFSPVAKGRPAKTGTDYLIVPGAMFDAAGGQIALTVDRVWYQPLVVVTDVILANLFVDVQIAAGGGLLARLGIYRANKNWQPTELVIDIGTIPIDGVTVVSIAVTEILGPGRYLIALTANGTATMGAYRAMSEFGILRTLGGSPILRALSVGRAYAALPDPGEAWDTTSSINSGGFQNFAILDIGTP